MKVILIVVALLTAACADGPTAPSVNDEVPCVIGSHLVPHNGVYTCEPR